MSDFIQLLIMGLGIGSVYALLAVGFVVIYKASSVLNFAYGQMVMISGYFVVLVLVQLELPILIGLGLAVVLAGIMGAGINHFLMKPMIGEPVISTVMITIALSQVLNAIGRMFWGGSIWGYPRFIPSEGIVIWDAIISQEIIYSIIAIVIVVSILSILFYRTSWGLAMRTVAEDHQIAKSMGIDVNFVFSLTWIIAGLTTSVAAIILGHYLGVGHTLTELGLRALPAALIGGFDSFPGAVIAGLLIGLAETFAAAYIDTYVGGGTANVFPYVMMILVILIRPYGLMGLKKVERI